MLDLNANWYKGITGNKLVDAAAGTFEKALGGYDVEMRSQVPYLPWLRIGARKYSWRGQTADDRNGWSYSADADITQNLSLEVGWSRDNYYTSNAFAKFVFRLARTDRPVMLSSDAISTKPFERRDMRVYTLDKVRRENKILVERSFTGGGVVIGRGN